MKWTDFDDIRDWVARQPASPKIRHARLTLFDCYRYAEEYEKLYTLINDIKSA